MSIREIVSTTDNTLTLNEQQNKENYVRLLNKYMNLEQAENHMKLIPEPPKYATGFVAIDDVLGGGFEAGQLVGVGGKFETGKTTLTVQMLENVSQGHKSAYFSFEFNVRQYVNRRKRPDSVVKENILIIDDEYEITDIEKNIESLSKFGGYKFFLIDSQIYITNNEIQGNKTEKLDDIFSRLAKCAVRNDVIIFMIVQTSAEDHRHKERAIRGSVNAGHVLKTFLFLDRVEKDGKDQIVCEFVKNKQNGIRKNIELHKVGQYNEFALDCYEYEMPEETAYVPSVGL